ncbi:unnamed protein product [Arabidopsis lyrata]|nr:unnamed protein product [Arabidopsis lyrata]
MEVITVRVESFDHWLLLKLEINVCGGLVIHAAI